MHDYDLSWKQWVDCEIYGPTLRHQRRNIKKLINGFEFNTVLDVGGGSGDNLREMIKNKNIKNVSLLDISAEALERAKKTLPEAELIKMDIQKENLNRKFDLILCCDVLEHIPDDLAALKNIRKMVGKYLVVSTLSGKMRDSEKNVGHLRNYTQEDISLKLTIAGFSIKKIVKWGFPFYSPLYRNLWNVLPEEINHGEFGFMRKLSANILYFIFMFNLNFIGDYLFILAEAV